MYQIEEGKSKNLFFPLFEKRKNTKIFGCNLNMSPMIIYYQ